MKCVSCEIEINPQWKHAIDMNVCPFCGKHIMEEHLKNLFVALAETMDDLEKYQSQLNDWMLSNHNYIKTDSPDIANYMPKDLIKDLKKAQEEKEFLERKKFTVKVQTERGVEEVQAEKIQSEEKTNDFFKRAEVIKPISAANHSNAPTAANTFQSPAEKTQHLKKVFQEIKKAGSTAMTDATGGASLISAEMLEQADPEAVAEFQSLITGGEVASSLQDNMDDEVPSHILAANIAAAAKSKGGGGATNAADLLKLQQMQERVKNSRESFESGANRGSKGGGFSRSG